METYFFYIIGFFVIIFLIYRHHNERKEKMRWDSLSEEQKDKELHDSIDEKSKQGLRDVLDQSNNISSSKKEHVTKENNMKNKIDKPKDGLLNNPVDDLLNNPVVYNLKQTFKSMDWLDTEDEQEFDKYVLYGGGSQKIIEMMQDLDDKQKIADVYNSYVEFKEKNKN